MKVLDYVESEWKDAWKKRFPLVKKIPKLDPENGFPEIFDHILAGAHRQHREEVNARARERYRTDPQYRKKTLKRGSSWLKKNKKAHNEYQKGRRKTKQEEKNNEPLP